MAGKIVIEIFKDENVNELTKLIADPESKLDTGSAVAANCAFAVSFLCRAAAISVNDGVTGEKIDYCVKNLETLRTYMVYLIDEDVKCRGPLRQAMKEGGERELAATRRPAVAICEELVNMTGQGLEIANKLCDICSADAKPYIEEYAYSAMAAARTAICYILAMSEKSPDETYRYVTRRENEMTMEQYTKLYDELLAKLK